MKTLIFAVCFLQLATFAFSSPLRAKPGSKAVQKAAIDSKNAFKALKQIKALKQAAASVPLPFNPETDDLEWPGTYPATSSSEKGDLVINIRLDDYPGEVVVNARAPFNMTAKNTQRAPMVNDGSQIRSIWTMHIDFPTKETLYQIEILDKMGNGICCGLTGYGWQANT